MLVIGLSMSSGGLLIYSGMTVFMLVYVCILLRVVGLHVEFYRWLGFLSEVHPSGFLLLLPDLDGSRYRGISK